MESILNSIASRARIIMAGVGREGSVRFNQDYEREPLRIRRRVNRPPDPSRFFNLCNLFNRAGCSRDTAGRPEFKGP